MTASSALFNLSLSGVTCCMSGVSPTVAYNSLSASFRAKNALYVSLSNIAFRDGLDIV